MLLAPPATRPHSVRPTLRPYQSKLKADVYQSWNSGARVVMAVAPTGAGKTVLFSDILEEHSGASCAIAHRQELVSQISLALARNGVRHRIIGQDKTRKLCERLHIRKLGRHFIDTNARCAVAGIATLVNIKPADHEYAWLGQVTLWVGDEGHHFLKENNWGTGIAMFRNPSVKGLLVTATPIRADGKGLGSHVDGLADCMVLAPSMRDLVNMGYLTDYRIFAPPSDLDLSQVTVSDATGDYNKDQVRKAVHASHIVGDVVAHYLKIAPGKLGITFAVDVDSATEIALAFKAAGVPAEVVHAKTPDDLRADIVGRFERREILQLVNVDLFGEGFDLPAIEVVSMARPTQSFSLYAQQFGRALRLMLDPTMLSGWDLYDDATRRYFISISSKPRAIIIDHVSNVVRHNGPPDKRIEWSLERRERRSSSKSDAIPYRVCVNPECTQPYERVYKCCPWCGNYPEPAARSSPAFVDGDLYELDEQTLAIMRGEIDRIQAEAVVPKGADYIVKMSIGKRHSERQFAQAALRNALAWYGGYLNATGVRDVSEQWRRFYFKFGIDIASAQALAARDADALRERIAGELAKYGIDATVNSGINLIAN